MKNIVNFANSLLRDESGLTTVEYAVGAAVITAGGAVAFGVLGDAVADVINDLAGLITPAAPPA